MDIDLDSNAARFAEMLAAGSLALALVAMGWDIFVPDEPGLAPAKVTPAQSEPVPNASS